jgi:hypothetical protein
MEQFVSLLGQFNSKGLLGLEGLVKLVELLLSCFFVATVLSSGKLKKGLISFLTATNTAKASWTLAAVPFCLTRCKTAMTWTKYSLLLPKP